MVTPYNAQWTINDFGQSFASLKYSASLAATTDTSLTVPGDAPKYRALIKVETGSDVWVALNETAAVPAGASFASVSSELLPGGSEVCRYVKAGDVLHFITAGATVDVGVVFYSTGVTTSGF